MIGEKRIRMRIKEEKRKKWYAINKKKGRTSTAMYASDQTSKKGKGDGGEGRPRELIFKDQLSLFVLRYRLSLDDARC